MKDQNINHAFLDAVLAGERTDVYYHFGVSSDDAVLDGLRDVSAVVMAGSGGRIKSFARTWSELNGGAPVVAFPEERTGSSPGTARGCCSPPTAWACPARPSRFKS